MSRCPAYLAYRLINASLNRRSEGWQQSPAPPPHRRTANSSLRAFSTHRVNSSSKHGPNRTERCDGGDLGALRRRITRSIFGGVAPIASACAHPRAPSTGSAGYVAKWSSRNGSYSLLHGKIKREDPATKQWS